MKTHLFKGGRITVNDSTIQIKGIFQSHVVQKHQIEGVNVFGSMFTGILCVCTVISAIRGIRILTGNRMVTISRTFDDPVIFWLPKNEVSRFRACI